VSRSRWWPRWLPASSAQNRAASGEIVLGMSAAFTGASGQLGIELYRGAQAYFAEVNATGGIARRPIRLMTLDDGYTPTRAIHNTITLVEKEQVPLLFGYVGTPTVTRVLLLLKRYESRGPYLLFPFTGAEPHRQLPYKDFVFNLRADRSPRLNPLDAPAPDLDLSLEERPIGRPRSLPREIDRRYNRISPRAGSQHPDGDKNNRSPSMIRRTPRCRKC
jgi:hypothetical protein